MIFTFFTFIYNILPRIIVQYTLMPGTTVSGISKKGMIIMSEEIKKGGLSIDAKHIFPIIKKWLYSDKEIFVRELVSNGCDAVTKHKRLVSLGEAKEFNGKYRIDVVLDKELGTITFSDNGIGMSEEELDKYINQIALSGAVDFISKYENESNDAGNGIIGHFGLGFYSAFMIADNVEIVTKSYVDGVPAMHWKGNDSCEFEMEPTERNTQGTDITLHVNDDEKEFLDAYRLKAILEKFCSFMPVEIYFTEKGAEKSGDSDKNEEEKPINDTNPLWQRKPSECKPEEYNEFYKKVFGDYRDPLFYIHINADYPLNFRGILFFPQFSNEYSNIEGQVKLYYNQVFVADNIKEVIPDYLLVLKGVLDCPELPLNVSRSYLQANGYVTKISAHIVKKVADKINSLFNTERSRMEEIWTQLKPFAEYGCMKDNKFYDRIKDSIIFKTTDDKFMTVSEYAAAENFDGTIYYTDDTVKQSRYISMFKNENINVAVLDKVIDAQFISFLEMKFKDDEATKEYKFSRVDSGFSASMRKDGDAVSNDGLCAFFKDALGFDDKTKVECESLKDADVPALLNLSEQSRRFSDMMKMYGDLGMSGSMPIEETLVVNLSNPLVAKIAETYSDEKRLDLNKAIAKQVYMLALVAQRQLTSDELKAFISGSTNLLEKL